MKSQLELLSEQMIALTVQMLTQSLFHLMQAHLGPQATAPQQKDTQDVK